VSYFKLDALLFGFNMTPQTPGNHVYALEASFGVTLAHGAQPDPSELGGVQSSFAVSGSLAEARSLRRRRRARAVPESQEPVLGYQGGPMQQDNEPMAVCMAAATARRSSGRVSESVDLQDNARGHVYAALGTHQSAYPIANENRYRICPYICSLTMSFILPFLCQTDFPSVSMASWCPYYTSCNTQFGRLQLL
jgi:hypothetical protein